MHPATALDCIKAFRPLTRKDARMVLDNLNAGWPTETVDEAQGIIDADAARLGGERPHPDRVIEAQRESEVPLEWTDGRLAHIVGVVLLVVLAALGALLFIGTAGASGPGCPGDPAWLGWCREVAP